MAIAAILCRCGAVGFDVAVGGVFDVASGFDVAFEFQPLGTLQFVHHKKWESFETRLRLKHEAF